MMFQDTHPLLPVLRECFLAGTGIQFHRSSFAGIGINPKDLYPFVVPRPAANEPTEELVKEMKRLAKHEAKIEVSSSECDKCSGAF